MTQNYYFLMFNTNRYKGVHARDEVTNKNQLSSDNSRRVFNIVEYFLQYNQVPSCNSINIKFLFLNEKILHFMSGINFFYYMVQIKSLNKLNFKIFLSTNSYLFV
ncbi:hypothetical protein EDEG_03184 [Edhazardia aedis USNM 41457]|uniref:Uncharacterized protein n=1 Tax=Edhazardia aedis (strain USNM 41457) TaxID=1003232 RepID=J9DID0_EDHAE|nr:hypothetical protein EDEG_03184 [Edhazardia aedis USNM 41457]|eukprot:EJW02380.1 hypothetical protein EDEG_03184 [Edhazardia aedis USNM 41457]